MAAAWLYDDGLAAVRALRANPPGRADGGRRSKTFGAALDQFEQLLLAAESVPPTSAPILLFYALSQAGRAILAAHAPQPWEVHGHGLSVHVEREAVGDTRITPAGEGLFQAVALATGSDLLVGDTTLTEVWGRIPALQHEAGLGAEQPPIFMVGDEPAGDLRRVVRDENGTLLRSADPFLDRGNRYPQLQAEVSVHEQGQFTVVTLEFNDRAAVDAFDHSLWTYMERLYLRPVSESGDPSGLLMWWMLLQGLSQLARYEPAGWTSALAPDRSVLAVPIEQVLKKAARLLPVLVLEALVSQHQGSA